MLFVMLIRKWKFSGNRKEKQTNKTKKKKNKKEKQLKDALKNNVLHVLLLFWTEFHERQCLFLIILLQMHNKSWARKIIKNTAYQNIKKKNFLKNKINFLLKSNTRTWTHAATNIRHSAINACRNISKTLKIIRSKKKKRNASIEETLTS